MRLITFDLDNLTPAQQAELKKLSAEIADNIINKLTNIDTSSLRLAVEKVLMELTEGIAKVEVKELQRENVHSINITFKS